MKKHSILNIFRNGYEIFMHLDHPMVVVYSPELLMQFNENPLFVDVSKSVPHLSHLLTVFSSIHIASSVLAKGVPPDVRTYLRLLQDSRKEFKTKRDQ